MTCSCSRPRAGAAREDHRLKPARLSFFNEQDAGPLSALVADASLHHALRALDARVTVGLRCLSDERAAAVRTLTGAGVPVDAWLLLPAEEGYFATFENLAAVERRVDGFLRWATSHELRFDALGFDFEPDLRELETLFQRPTRALLGWARRSFDRPRHARARDGYRALLARVRSAGFAVEAYQFPLLVEDRAAGSDFFQRFAGALDLPVGREVLMAYTSLLGPFGPGLLEGWARTAQAVAVGSTGGGVDPLPKLTFGALSRDLRLAAARCADVRVFSLEGCVASGALPRLLTLDWDAPVELSAAQRFGAASLRGAARGLSALLR